MYIVVYITVNMYVYTSIMYKIYFLITDFILQKM